MELFICLTLSKVMNFKISRREKLIVSSTSPNLQFDLPVQLLSIPSQSFTDQFLKPTRGKGILKFASKLQRPMQRPSLLNNFHFSMIFILKYNRKGTSMKREF